MKMIKLFNEDYVKRKKIKFKIIEIILIEFSLKFHKIRRQ